MIMKLVWLVLVLVLVAQYPSSGIGIGIGGGVYVSADTTTSVFYANSTQRVYTYTCQSRTDAAVFRSMEDNSLCLSSPVPAGLVVVPGSPVFVAWRSVDKDDMFFGLTSAAGDASLLGLVDYGLEPLPDDSTFDVITQNDDVERQLVTKQLHVKCKQQNTTDGMLYTWSAVQVKFDPTPYHCVLRYVPPRNYTNTLYLQTGSLYVRLIADSTLAPTNTSSSSSSPSSSGASLFSSAGASSTSSPSPSSLTSTGLSSGSSPSPSSSSLAPSFLSSSFSGSGSGSGPTPTAAPAPAPSSAAHIRPCHISMLAAMAVAVHVLLWAGRTGHGHGHVRDSDMYNDIDTPQ